MKIFKLLGVNFALAMLLAACGGGPNNTLTAPSSGVVQYTTPTSIVATTNSTSVLSDGSTSATITVLALDANHVLLTNSQISFAASSGTLKVTNAVTNANGQAQATLTAIGSSASSITVTATAGKLTSTVDVQIIPAAQPPTVAAVSLVSDTQAILSDGTTAAKLTAFVKDANGNLLPNIAVAFSASSGGIAPVTANSTTTDASGTATAALSTAGDPSLRTITVTATVGGFTAQVQVAVVAPAQAASISISAAPTTVAAGKTTTITVAALDSNNVALPIVPVAVAATAGVLSIPALSTTGPTGTFVDTLTVPSSANGSTITVTATSGGLSQSIAITVLGAGALTADRIAVSSSASAILSDGSTTATITAIAVDANNNLLSNVPISLSASSGALAVGDTVTVAGSVTATLSTGLDPSIRTITITAKSGSLTATATVDVVPNGISSPVASVTVLANPASINNSPPTDKSTVTAYVRDASNNLLANVPVVFSVSSGGIAGSTSLTGANGTATAVVATAGDPTIRIITVTATAGGVSGTIPIQVTNVPPSGNTIALGSATVSGTRISNFTSGNIGIAVPTISANGTTTLQVVLYVQGATALYAPATPIYFTSTCLGLAQNPSTISPASPVLSTSQSVPGQVIVTYTPGAGCYGQSDVITASATVGGSTVTATGTVNIAAAGSISFASATPSIIALPGVNTLGRTKTLPTTSTVRFHVVDGFGSGLANQPVTLAFDESVAGGPTMQSGSTCVTPVATCTVNTDSAGDVSATVTSGTIGIAFHVTATTTIASSTLATESGFLYVSTGIPAANSFALNLQCPNIEAGFSGHSQPATATNSSQIPLTATLADRFGFPVPDGTLVSFSAEGGTLAKSSCTTTTVNGVSSCAVNWKAVGSFPVPELQPGYLANQACQYGVSCLPGTSYDSTHYDRYGRSTLLAIAIGEESLVDPTNAAPVPGDYTALGDPFRDDNENGKWDTIVSGTDQTAGNEYFFDSLFANPAAGYQGNPGNPDGLTVLAGGDFIGVLCGGGHCAATPVLGIAAQQVVVLSGSTPDGTAPTVASTSPTPYTLSAAVAQTSGFQFTVADANMNPMPAGTTIKASVGSGLVVNPGSTSFVVPCELEPNTISVFVTGASTITSTPVTSTLTLVVRTPAGVTTTLTYAVQVTP